MRGLILPPGAFRLLLAYAVLASHISALDIGRLAVLLFFFLSGYWIANIWETKFAASDTGRFYLSRYLRIVPLFLIVTLAAAWIRNAALGPTNFTLLGLGVTGNDPTTVSWSLDVELQFYLLAPLLLLALRRWTVLTLGCAVSLVALGLWAHQTLHAVTVLKFLPPFLLGALTYAKRWTPSERMAHLSLAAFAGATAISAATLMLFKTQPHPWDRDVYGMLWMLPLLPYVARSLTVRGPAIDRDLGNLSFPLYLIHPAVIYVVGQHMHGSLAKVVIVAGATAVAAGVYYLIDRPLDRWRVKLTEGAPQPATARA